VNVVADDDFTIHRPEMVFGGIRVREQRPAKGR